MKYDILYPAMRPIVDEKHGVIRGTEKCPCGVCGEPTEYIEINYEGYFCSEECLNEMDRRAAEDGRRTGTWPDVFYGT